MAYARNFLKAVVFQPNFEPILKLETESPGAFQEQIRDRYPVLQEGIELEVQADISDQSQPKSQAQIRRRRWIFQSSDKAKSVTVAANLFSLEYTKYKSIEEMEADFDYLWSKFLAIYTPSAVNRVGLRYINVIELPTGDPFEWNELIDDRLVSTALGFKLKDGGRLARSMHASNWCCEEYNITFQFGLFNSEFPNPIAKKEFVLDYDCYATGPIDLAQVKGFLVRFNKTLERLFEDCIKDGLRRLMSAEGK